MNSTNEGDPDGVFVDDIYLLYESAGKAVIIFRKSELGMVEFVEQIPNGIRCDRMIGQLFALRSDLLVYGIYLIGETLELAVIFRIIGFRKG